MNRLSYHRSSGAALLITLILVSVIAMVSISYLGITQRHAEVSHTQIHAVQADLGERAALADATHLLESFTGSDQYLVTSTSYGNTSQGGAAPRYTFITLPEGTQLTHIPLFAGGQPDTGDIPEFNQTPTVDLADVAAARPTVRYDSSPQTTQIKTFKLTQLDTDGAYLAEDQHPTTGFVELPPTQGSPYRTRYTFWSEDLEGYYNLNALGAWTDDYESPITTAMDFVRLGYSHHDLRAGGIGNDRFPMSSESRVHFQFPEGFRGQQFVNQVAPGLSPREISLIPWSTEKVDIFNHPFYQTDQWISFRSSFASNPTRFQEERFSQGLRPYRHVPHIPYGHDYIDEGAPRFLLNELVANRDIEIAHIIERNLPEFEDRKGGFPDPESYLATLAANAIDYADADALPSTPLNTINASDPTTSAPLVFRGVDNYCPVNEFFVKFKYKGYEDHGDHYKIVFEAIPFVEFWNPFNEPAQMQNVTLDFRFIEPIQFKANSVNYEIKANDIVENNALSIPQSITVESNEFLIHQFGSIRWEVEVPVDKTSPIAFPVVQELKGKRSSTTRANYQLLIGNTVVDSCGRQGANPASSREDYGFFFPKWGGVIGNEDHIMRMAVPSLTNNNAKTPKLYGSHLGDPWMVYYSLSTADGTSDQLYQRKGSPGSRNFDHDKVDSGRPDQFNDQHRVRDWPDRGYEAKLATVTPSDESELPNAFTTTAEPGKAPWRISNRSRYFSVTELGNLHDPVMWATGPTSGANSVIQKQSNQLFDKYRDTWLKSLPSNATPSSAWGGGNTLRIGRPEHGLFDQPGMRASQLLDLFHAGENGSNLLSDASANDDDLYHFYDPRDHHPLPTGLDAAEANSHPFNHLYESDLHAQSPYRLIYGHLNLNSAPTRFEIETLLRGPFSSSWWRLDQDSYITPTYTSAADQGSVLDGLDVSVIPDLANDLYDARPFYSPSHLARVLSHLIDQYDALPDHHNDAEAEETFARIFNTTHFSSRHFRIFTYAETYHSQTNEIVARARRVYEVFLNPIRDNSGEITTSRMEILSRRRL